MLKTLLFLLVVWPFIAAGLIFFLRSSFIRSAIVVGTGGLLAASSLALLSHGPFVFTPQSFLGINPDAVVAILDFALLFIMLWYGFKLKNTLIKVLVGVQIVALAWFELFMMEHAAPFEPMFADNLSLIMVLIVSIIGPLVTFYAIPYMKRHEEHLKLEKSRQPQFFFFMVLFLGAMNGLVLANSILWMYFFFEITTFCCFMLIAHDQTEIAIHNGTKALWMNCIAGVAFVIAIVWGYSASGTVNLTNIIQLGPMGGAMLAPLAFLCLAGMVKAAQCPLQGWLLGAMVAPTPVSALLHSSTMVKAGVYIVLRLAPAYAGTLLSDVVAVAGAFTFLAAAALAIGQRNGKKVLAYSTISNLGLIVACAGINTPAAITAGILLIIFHAVSKGMLFMCVGHIDQIIGSKDVEAMRGLYNRMPTTTLITIIGVISMLLPPFGVLISKWMAIEAASTNIFAVTMMALGSALTLVYWARWAGILLDVPFGKSVSREHMSVLTSVPLKLLAAFVIVLGIGAPLIYNAMIKPMFAEAPFTVGLGGFFGQYGSFAVVPLFLILGIGVAYAVVQAKRGRMDKAEGPYLCGANLDDPLSFKGPMNKPVAMSASNYYLESIFGENRLTVWVNLGSLALIALMIGGAL